MNSISKSATAARAAASRRADFAVAFRDAAVAPVVDFAQPVIERLDEQMLALGVVQQIVDEIGIAPHYPDIAQYFEEHACGTAGAAFVAQFREYLPCLLSQQAQNDFAVGIGGVVIGDFTQARGSRERGLGGK